MAKYKIFIYGLDDSEDDLFFIKQAIEGTGEKNYILFTHDEELVHDLPDGIHVYIIDHNLGARNGLYVCKKIREKSLDSIIIVYSGGVDPDTYEDYINNDINRWVNKRKDDHIERLTEYILVGLVIARRRIDIMRELEKLGEKLDNDKGQV